MFYRGLKHLAVVGAVLSAYSNLAFAEVKMEQVPSLVELSGKEGGRVDGKAWSSAELKGKFHLVVYTPPTSEKKDLNNEATERVKKENFAAEHFASVAIINMAAAKYIPNFLIDRSLKRKQQDYPRTVYVRDLERKIVKEWGLSDNENIFLLFNPEGKLIFKRDGKLSAADTDQLIALIKNVRRVEIAS